MCMAKVDTHGFARPNYMSQSTVETPVGAARDSALVPKFKHVLTGSVPS